MLFPTLFFLLLGCLCSWLIIQLCLAANIGKGSEELQHHHSHTGVVPRIGGLGIILGFGLTYILCFIFLEYENIKSPIYYGIFAGAVASFLLGLIDDFRPLGAKLKLSAQIAIAFMAYSCGLSVDMFVIPFTDIQVNLGIFGSVLTVFWIVSMMNIINLIDGLDGLAGGIGLMLMSLLAYLAFESNIVISYILALGMVGAIIGFLFHNFPPAKAYLGDSGAYLIGFVIASLSLLNSEKGAVLAALIAPMLALALPIADVAYAIIRRAIRGLPLFRPDKEHIHHKFLRAGHSRQRTVLFLYAISLLALVGGLLAFAYQGRYLPIFMGFTSFAVLFVFRSQKISLLGMRNELNETLRVRQDARTAIYLRDWFLLETERADSGSNLWEDYIFILKKMGICQAELTIGEIKRTFSLPDSPSADVERMWHAEHSIGDQATLHVCADRENFSENHFSLIADIAAEAWSKAALRWKEINDCSLDFDCEAGELTNYQQQKARSLYRPTYP